ncbi:MAG: reverse transcriptase domain-containing protein, partial [Mycobacterium sp.]
QVKLGVTRQRHAIFTGYTSYAGIPTDPSSTDNSPYLRRSNFGLVPPPGVERRLDAVRVLQHPLYRAAKADPERRFHALYDKVHRRDVLQRAWSQVRPNNGAPGIDQITLAEVEQYGVSRLLDELEAELRAGTFRPIPARRVFIPKPGTEERRPLSIPAVRDRIVQAAVKIVLEPVFEADFLPCSFGFRPKRAAHEGLQVLVNESFASARWVVETDVADCFGAIPHSGFDVRGRGTHQ